jgi:hypothetical protein
MSRSHNNWPCLVLAGLKRCSRFGPAPPAKDLGWGAEEPKPVRSPGSGLECLLRVNRVDSAMFPVSPLTPRQMGAGVPGTSTRPAHLRKSASFMPTIDAWNADHRAPQYFVCVTSNSLAGKSSMSNRHKTETSFLSLALKLKKVDFNSQKAVSPRSGTSR